MWRSFHEDAFDEIRFVVFEEQIGQLFSLFENIVNLADLQGSIYHCLSHVTGPMRRKTSARKNWADRDSTNLRCWPRPNAVH